MPSWQSIRFRLSVQYSALVFGLGGALLGLVYLATQRGLRSQTMMAHLWEGRAVAFEDGTVFSLPYYSESEVHAIETIYNRVVLDGPDDELKRLADTFDDMLERLDAAFSSQRQFLADTSHDLRTPLTVIRSNVELVAADEGATTEDWNRAGTVIQRNAERMSEMIQALLATARLQTGKAQSVTLDLAELVDAKVSDFTTIAAERSVRVEARSERAVALGVEVALDRALTNLVDNAVKAAPAGSAVLVGSGVADGWAWLGVRDAGPGLPGDPGDRVGLGLSIVTQIAESHGGELASFPGSGGTGTTMVVWIPTETGGGRPPESSPFTDT